MTEKKMTKRDFYKGMLAMAEIASNPNYVDFINHELELLDRKNGNRKPTATQIENENIKDLILKVLDKPMTATEIMKAVQPMVEKELSNQKITALLRSMLENGVVTKIKDKRTSLFERA